MLCNSNIEKGIHVGCIHDNLSFKHGYENSDRVKRKSESRKRRKKKREMVTSVEIVSGDHFFASLDKASDHVQSSHATVDGKGPLGRHDLGEVVLYWKGYSSALVLP